LVIGYWLSEPIAEDFPEKKVLLTDNLTGAAITV
jgi:hypothetical protein